MAGHCFNTDLKYVIPIVSCTVVLEAEHGATKYFQPEDKGCKRGLSAQRSFSCLKIGIHWNIDFQSEFTFYRTGCHFNSESLYGVIA